MAFKLPKTPLKYVLPGVLGILDNREGVEGFYDLLRLHPQEWLFAAERAGDERLKHLLAEYRKHAREARVELQNLLTAEVIGDEYDYHT